MTIAPIFDYSFTSPVYLSIYSSLIRLSLLSKSYFDFINDLEAKYVKDKQMCMICQESKNKTVQLSCYEEHILCYDCLNDYYFKYSNRKCPYCNLLLNESEFRRLISSKSLVRKYERLQIKLEKQEKNKHLRRHEYNPSKSLLKFAGLYKNIHHYQQQHKQKKKYKCEHKQRRIHEYQFNKKFTSYSFNLGKC